MVLDQTLSEIRRIAAPRDMTGVPILSGDGKTLYYCTATALRCWDLEGGNRRLLRDFAVTGQTLAGLLAGDTLAVCARSGRTLLVSTRDGRLKYDEEADLDARNGIWYAALRQDQLLLFGEGPQSVRQATTPDLGPARFLPRLHGAVSQGTSGLRYFDLSTGLSSELLSLAGPVLQIEGDRGSVYILARDPAYDSPVLYRWVPTLSGENCLSPYPDQDLTSCRSLAEAMGKRYGLRILIGEDAAGPWDYDLTPEPLAPITARALELVDKGLSCYPETMLSDALAPFSSLTISLVRSIAGVPGSGGVAAADGLQFFQGTDAFIVLAAGPRTEAEVHHELFHVMETRLLTSSTALDQWDNLNPAGFTYGYGSPEYLQGEERAFVDEYSMTLPKEDRARILEAAMTPGNAELFRSPILQEKLKALCHGLREAYGLKTAPEAFLWEQYLEEPLY